MTSTDRERWQRVKDQLRNQLGEDVFTSWFGRMELDAVENGTVRLSVPTRFLRTWIQSHYSEQVLAKWQAEDADHQPLGAERPLGGDPPAGGQAQAGRAGGAVTRAARHERRRKPRQRAVHERARGARRLAARSAPDLRAFHRRPLEHAGACRGQAGRDQPARRAADVQPALYPRRASASAKPTCCRRSPGPATAATARCSI